MRIIVAQIGARRGYAVPAILEKAGILERFYTDITGDIGVGALLSSAALLPFSDNPARRLASRRLPPQIRAKTKTFPGVTLFHALRSAMIRRGPTETFRESLRFSNELGHAMRKCGFESATHMYSMHAECAPLFIAAKERGLSVICELYIPLSTERILAEERKKFPGWEPDMPDFGAILREFGVGDMPLGIADFAICLSESVRDDLVTNFNYPPERATVVPYAISSNFFSVRNQPVRGRILFAGTAELRKGIHYFAMAAERLMTRGFHYEFRIAGDVRRSIANQKVCRHLTFLGRIPRVQMVDEYAAADLFVMPSLSEGGPGVNYEALACGIPVVTTPESRAGVRDGIDGRVVPSRDPIALADAIADIIEDREKRNRMSRAGRERAHDFIWSKYAERLIAAVQKAA